MAGESWLEKIRVTFQLDALQFAECWKRYDEDDSGFIEGDEIDHFFDDILTRAFKDKTLSPPEKKRWKEELMNVFDENRDGKIEMAELAQILPREDNFLAMFRSDNSKISCKAFMQIWRKYASKKDYVAADELSSFISEMFAVSGKPMPQKKVVDYSKTVIQLYDTNGDGRLSFKEMARLLPPHENVLLRFEHEVVLSGDTFEKLFQHYDQDGNGTISGEELDTFLRDIAGSISSEMVNDGAEFEKFKKLMLETCDSSGDGCLSRDEIALWLGLQ